MASKNAPKDANAVSSTLFENSSIPGQTLCGQIDQTTGRILVDASGINISSSMQTDIFSSTNNQTVFTASKTVAYTFGFYVNGSLYLPSSNYTVSSNVATLASGIPSGCDVVWVYSTK